MLDKEKLREIRERVEKATQGPWEDEYEADPEGVAYDRFISTADERIGLIWEQENADFVAHAREDVPALLDHIEKSGRSTPLEYADLARVHDMRGNVWSYSEPADVWRVVNDKTLFVVPTSARSYQRLVAEFGPLRPTEEEG